MFGHYCQSRTTSKVIVDMIVNRFKIHRRKVSMVLLSPTRRMGMEELSSQSVKMQRMSTLMLDMRWLATMMRLRQSPWIRTKDRRRMVESLMRKRMRLVVGVGNLYCSSPGDTGSLSFHPPLSLLSRWWFLLLCCDKKQFMDLKAVQCCWIRFYTPMQALNKKH